MELHLHEPRMALDAGPRPKASALARMQARDGNTVTTLLHTSVLLDDELARCALQLQYRVQLPDGTVGETVSGGWDRTSNKQNLSAADETITSGTPPRRGVSL